jgi:hypothetical protein
MSEWKFIQNTMNLDLTSDSGAASSGPGPKKHGPPAPY